MKSAARIKEAFREAVGSDRFFDAPETVGAYVAGNSPVSGAAPSCAVKPRNTEDIVKVVKTAADTGANLVTRSSAPSGSCFRTAIPEKFPTVVVDLSDMKRITWLDRRNKVAVVEPGVTFGMLQAEARKKNLRALPPLLPRAAKSVVASCLEREPITIPKYHWDMTDPMLCVEVVFGNGEVFRTGGAAGPGTLEQQRKAGAAQKNPMGPAQTDLVRIVQGAQGTMGIVTWSSVKLEVLPTIRKGYFVTSGEIEPIIGLLYEMTRLRLADELFILNRSSLAGITDNVQAAVGKRSGEPQPWILFYCVAGYEYFPELRVRQQEEDIAALARKHGLQISRNVSGVSGDSFAGMIDMPCREPYWKHRYKGTSRDLFFITTMDYAPLYLDVVRGLAEKTGFPREEIGVYVQPIQQGRNCHIEFTIPYNPADEKDVRRAEDLFNAASREVYEKGAFFSRPYGRWAELAYSDCPDTVGALKTVKGIFDPDNIFNKGGLCL